METWARCVGCAGSGGTVQYSLGQERALQFEGGGDTRTLGTCTQRSRPGAPGSRARVLLAGPTGLGWWAGGDTPRIAAASAVTGHCCLSQARNAREHSVWR